MTIPAWLTWKAIKAAIASVPHEIWYAAAVVTLAWLAYSWAYNRGADAVQSRWDAATAQAELEAQAQAAEADRIEQEQVAEFAAIVDSLRKENHHAKQNADRLVADLRAGTVRVRDRFTCPRPMPAAAGSPARSDEAGQAGLLAADAEFLVRLASEADAAANQLTACQDILRAER